MSSPVTGYRCAILRKNPDSVVVPFDTRAYDVRIDPADSILSLSERLAKYGGGGTNCSIPLHQANTKYRKRQFAGMVLVSDNESWVYRNQAFANGRQGATGVMRRGSQSVEQAASAYLRYSLVQVATMCSGRWDAQRSRPITVGHVTRHFLGCRTKRRPMIK